MSPTMQTEYGQGGIRENSVVSKQTPHESVPGRPLDTEPAP